MMSYSVIKNDKNLYDILEKDSEVVIEVSKHDEDEARSVCRKLNLGSGFNGWTPEFVAKRKVHQRPDSANDH
jgi:hypothetical protein